MVLDRFGFTPRSILWEFLTSTLSIVTGQRVRTIGPLLNNGNALWDKCFCLFTVALSTENRGSGFWKSIYHWPILKKNRGKKKKNNRISTVQLGSEEFLQRTACHGFTMVGTCEYVTIYHADVITVKQDLVYTLKSWNRFHGRLWIRDEAVFKRLIMRPVIWQLRYSRISSELLSNPPPRCPIVYFTMRFLTLVCF